MLTRYAAQGWGNAKSDNAFRGNIPIGVAFGSGYQNRFVRTLTPDQRTAAVQKMRDNGITWARIDAEWWVTEVVRGTYTWTDVDTTVNALIAGGINVVVLLHQTPAWAFLPANTAPLFASKPTPDPALYAKYCADAVRHFSTLGVHVYELWNEPNLTTASSPSGWNEKSVAGFTGLSVAAYPAMKAADPNCFVLAGTLATASEFGTAGVDKACSWSAVPSGAATAIITCASAVAADVPGFIYDAASVWPTGTAITAVGSGTYTVSAPPWSTGGLPAIAAGSGTLRVQNTQLAPDFYLARVYEAAAGKPWCDALAIHPYTQPVVVGEQRRIYGGWAVVQDMRNTMVANGDGAKPMWLTEFGAPGGAPGGASWSAAAATDTALVISCSQASALDLNYQISGTGLSAGTWISAVTAGVSWTVSPSTALTIATAITAGQNTTSITLAATPSGPVTIASGTILTIAPQVNPGTYQTLLIPVTTTAPVTTSTTITTVVPVVAFAPVEKVSLGSPILASLGQTFGAAIAAASGQKVNLAPQGAIFAFGQNDDATMAKIIESGLQAISAGSPGVNSGPGAPPWPFAHGTPVFIYNWEDTNSGTFGLQRIDGTSKPAMAVIKRYATGSP
jgi:hypothetical protein